MIAENHRPLLLRPALFQEIPRIKALYKEELERLDRRGKREAKTFLPIPDLGEIVEATSNNRFLVIEDIDTQEVLAASAVFSMIPLRTQILELCATTVHDTLGGMAPLSVHALLLIMRLLDLVVLHGTANTTLLVIVHRANDNSNATFRALGLAPIENKPQWLLDEEISWYGWPDETLNGSEWNYYGIEDQTIRMLSNAFLQSFDFKTKSLKLSRQNRRDGNAERFQVFLDAAWIDQFNDRAVLTNRLQEQMVLPIPPELDFRPLE
jgi:hypothetical protein